jgi:hypothetical protein
MLTLYNFQVKVKVRRGHEEGRVDGGGRQKLLAWGTGRGYNPGGKRIEALPVLKRLLKIGVLP